MNWLQFMMGNPGAHYPRICSSMQYSVLNDCEQVFETAVHIVLVKPLIKEFTDKELTTGMNDQILAYFDGANEF